ncbi:hypothetical protein FZI85_19790 [Mycobacterium sp. CBMA293]|nr:MULTISPECIES: hypothetical protein [unclassified Mycolicibacterium]MUL60925.1 hypothetical protein [Mycolicibacterium sp. CBMA 335]MUL71938.1 hypothetical protein [Mycolicibacterium sp. CBMA 311]MUM09039.1 hypothetical protein [Mycolicibacterium sp. CBMA 213]MUM13253.1 hypothetical protein [Mycolicibacterium sp. CBMA 293]MUL49061.1 hypothetical protein [Mycolicibacterium sp. CBMA 360]
MIRGALWLMQVVGEGNTFTKNQLRDAFPGVSQIDRRIRDLRDYGWIVYSNTEDASLLTEDQRFVKAGVPVWDPKSRRAAAPEKAISSKDRQAVLVRDSYMCTLCGIAGGEPYPDDEVMTAVLAVSRRTSVGLDGVETEALMTECKRCRSGLANTPIRTETPVDIAAGLGPGELRRLLRWMERGRRGATELDRAWAAYIRVPPEMRKDIADRIRSMQQ